MHRFEVWAPLAKRAAVGVNGTALEIQGPDEQGWWHLDVDHAGPGTDYGYYIDGGETCYPDPRSQWQPNGVHGLSRVYDQSAFAWTDTKFQAPPLAGGVVYELHIGTFTEAGTLDAAIAKLDYLVDLGVTHVEVMPVASFTGDRGWGYDGVDLFSVFEPYGGPDALKGFVDAAHEKALAVLLDVVYNHFGPVGNYTGKYGPYLTDLHHTPWGGAVNFEEAGSHQVRRFLCDNALMWMRDYHIDGLRLDAVHTFIDRSAIHFMEQLATEVEELGAMLGRRFVLIAESDLNDPRIVTSREGGGLGMDAQWCDDFHHALFTVLNPGVGGYYSDFGSLGHLAKALERTFVYDGTYSVYRDRVHGRRVGSLSQHRFVGFIQNHDQVGNTAVGERIFETIGFDRAKIAAAIVLTSPFIPMLFQGEEWAASTPFQYFANHEDKAMAHLVSEGRKREFSKFGWNPDLIPDPERRETFERSKLKWNELGDGVHAEMLAWYRALIRLRRSTPSLNNGEPGHIHVSFNQDENWLSIERGDITVSCNLGVSERSFNVPQNSQVVLGTRENLQVNGDTITLPPDTLAVVSRNGAGFSSNNE
jgi:maltooligosyltrehalose trehalohydrolase